MGSLGTTIRADVFICDSARSRHVRVGESRDPLLAARAAPQAETVRPRVLGRQSSLGRAHHRLEGPFLPGGDQHHRERLSDLEEQLRLRQLPDRGGMRGRHASVP